MGLWKWAKGMVMGDVFHDYGQVLEWSDGGATTALYVQLSRFDDESFFLITRTSSSAFLSKRIVFSRIEVTEADLERWLETLGDALTRIRSKRAELSPK